MRVLEARFCLNASDVSAHEQMEITMGLPMCEWLRMQIERHKTIQQWMDDYSIMWEDIATIEATQDIDAKVHAVLVFDETKRETRLWCRGSLRTPARITRPTLNDDARNQQTADSPVSRQCLPHG